MCTDVAADAHADAATADTDVNESADVVNRGVDAEDVDVVVEGANVVEVYFGMDVDVDVDVVVDVNMDVLMSGNVDVGGDLDVDVDQDVDSDAGVDVGVDADAHADVDGDADADEVVDVGVDVKVEAGTVIDVGVEDIVEAGADADVDVDMGISVAVDVRNAYGDADADVDIDMDVDVDVDVDADEDEVVDVNGNVGVRDNGGTVVDGGVDVIKRSFIVLYVQLIYGPTAVITVEPASDGSALRDAVEAATGVPTRHQTLAYAGRDRLHCLSARHLPEQRRQVELQAVRAGQGCGDQRRHDMHGLRRRF